MPRPGLVRVLVLAVAVASVASLPAAAQPFVDLIDFWGSQYLADPPPELLTGVPSPLHPHQLLARAEPDECFAGIGEPYPALEPDGTCPQSDDPEAEPVLVKTNPSYVFGLTAAGDDLWFGTVANYLCQVPGMFLDAFSIPAETFSLQTTSWVCEFGNSQPYQDAHPNLSSGQGDWRRPQIFRYRLGTSTLEDLSPTSGAGLAALEQTEGLRAAGNLDGVVLLGGPDLAGDSIYLFAYDAASGAFLGSRQVTGYTNLRSFAVAGGELYAAVGTDEGEGEVWRWTGNTGSPFDFVTVGELDAPAAFLAEHDGRLFATTWPGVADAGLHASPPLPPGGLTAADAGSWTPILYFSDYDPDPSTALSYLGGAIASWDGYLWFGTMQVPLTGLAAALLDIGPDALDGGDGSFDVEDFLALALGTYRATALFRAHDLLTPDQEIEVAYGQRYLPVYDPTAETYTIAEDADHETGFGPPLFGAAGFGNPFNVYTWTMATYQGALFVGTFDWSFLPAQVLADLIASGPPLPPELAVGTASGTAAPAMPRRLDLAEALAVWGRSLGTALPLPVARAAQLAASTRVTLRALAAAKASPAAITEEGDPELTDFLGADLFRFDDPEAPAAAEDISGLGDYASYGVRALVAGDALYAGMANPMNLLDGTVDPFGALLEPPPPTVAAARRLTAAAEAGGLPPGGWQLIQIGEPLAEDVPALDAVGLGVLALLLAAAAVLRGRRRLRG